MKVLDISTDGRLKLVAEDDLSAAHYVPHDGAAVTIDDVLAPYLIQCHIVACAERDGTMNNGLVAGRMTKPDYAAWRIVRAIKQP